MPRRIYTYPSGMGWDASNLVVTIGGFFFAAGVALLLVNVLASLRRGRPASSNPWDAPTLEWLVPSPPPPYNFAVIPTVGSRHPLWEGRIESAPARSSLGEGLLLDEGRETVGTSALDAEPDLILQMPEDTTAPFWLALGLAVAFGFALPHAWTGVAAGLAVSGVALIVWFWPRQIRGEPRAGEPIDG
jgi:cytochrome c oxidase subunit 1/cytochrome c oxidase subunit I+III